MDGFIPEASTGFHVTPRSCASRPRKRVLGFLTRKERHASLFDPNALSKRHLPMLVQCMDPSPSKSRWDAHERSEQSGEKRREGERGEPITQRAEQRMLPLYLSHFLAARWTEIAPVSGRSRSLGYILTTRRNGSCKKSNRSLRRSLSARRCGSSGSTESRLHTSLVN